MKLLELFARLDELQSKIIIRTRGEIAGVYQTRRSDTPSVIFLSRDGPELNDSE